MTAPAGAGQRPDPEDVPYAGSVFWALRACEVLGALMFATVLPWWKPLLWWLLVAGTGSARSLYLHSARFKAIAPERRRWHFRWTIWTMMACVGSAAYFLYLPGNNVMHAVLGVYLLGSAALVALRTAGDLLRTAVAVCLVLLPTAARFLVEGVQHSPLLALLGIGGGLMAATIIFMSRLQERALMQQFEMRQRAERAADAVASVGLAKSRFFAAVSHDLRQPVHAIGLYLDPLIKLARTSQDEAAQRAAEGIRQSWRALDDLLSQVLDLTRMDSGALQAQLQSVELAPLVRDLVMQHSAAAERAGIRVVALVETGRFAAADALMLKRVLSNLLDNAIKFSPAGRPVVIALRRAPLAWRLQVRDAGIGIAPEAQARIFEEFVQINNEARDRQRGLGLGLAISRRFLQLMGGSIAVRSAPGRGCCMTVTLPEAPVLEPLPRYEPHRSQSFVMLPEHAESAPMPLAPALQPQEVLLVEDDLLVSAAMRQLLQSWGMQVRHVETAAEALAQPRFGQLAVCDLRLP
ncbi:MAG: hypothetical protein EOO25_04205, partial [Comamonadaceae bacterium]